MTSMAFPSLDITSFDEVVEKNNNMDFGSLSLTKSLNESSNKNLLNCFKIFDEEYPSLVKSFYSFSKKHSKKSLSLRSFKLKNTSLKNYDKTNSSDIKRYGYHR